MYPIVVKIASNWQIKRYNKIMHKFMQSNNLNRSKVVSKDGKIIIKLINNRQILVKIT